MGFRILFTVLFLLAAVVSLGVAFLFGIDPEGRGGKYILGGMVSFVLCLLAIIPTWLMFRH